MKSTESSPISFRKGELGVILLCSEHHFLYNRMDSDWLSMFLSSSAGKKIVLKVIPSSYRPGCEQAFKQIVYIDCVNQFKRTAL